MDSGLPHDDITPRSDSLSTASSSASPPDQQHGLHHHAHHPHHRELIQQHRKSTSMDDINGPNSGVRIVPGQSQQPQQPQQHWKSYSLQRGSTAPNSSNESSIYASTTNTDGTVVIRRAPPAKAGQQDQEEDIYGRCTNMKLTSFADTSNRDPRIIDLTLGSSPSTSQNGLDQGSSRTGSPVVTASYPQQHQPNFNTLPAQVSTYIFLRCGTPCKKLESLQSSLSLICRANQDLLRG